MGILRTGGRLPRWARVAITVVAVWDVAWKGVALWQAARRRQPAWFVALLIVNSAGVLPIAYLVRSRRRDQEEAGATEDASSTQD